MAPRVLVCVPVGTEQATLVATGETVPGPLQVFCANAELLASFGLTAADDEEADFACLLVAGLWGLAHHGRRLVLTAQVDPGRLGDGAETANGGRVLEALPAERVEAFFADESDAGLGAVAEAVRGLEIDAAWELPEVERMHREDDLMWHSVIELPAFVAATREGA